MDTEAYIAFMRRNRLMHISELNRFVIKGQIVFVGSSLCEYFPVNELLNGEDKRYIVYNRGIAGDTTDQMLGNLEECVFALEPAKIFINIGTNDMNTPDYDENRLMENYRKILTRIKDRLPQVKIYMLSYYPVNPDVESPMKDQMKETFNTRNNRAVLSANGRLQQLAKECGCVYIDLHPLLIDPRGNLDKQYTLEGIHLKPNAYQIVLKKLLPYFD